MTSGGIPISTGGNGADEPQPWAIFKCTHDAFRTAINEMEYLLTQEEAWRKESFSTLWSRYQRFAQLHSDMEDYGFFPLLDKVSNKAFSNNGFWEEHQGEVSSAMKVDRAVDIGRQTGNWTKVLETFRVWKKQHLKHLSHEEEVWEESLNTFGATLQERCQLIHQEVITPMDQHDHNLCLQFYSWIVRYLSTFGTINQSPKEAAIFFVRGLRSVCSAQQWARFMPAVHAVCDDSVWQHLLTHYNIHSADPIAAQLFGSGYQTTDHSNAPSGRATPAESEQYGSDGTRNKDGAPKTTRASFLFTLSQPAVRAFGSFYGAELEPPIIQSSDFPPSPHADNNRAQGAESKDGTNNSPNDLASKKKARPYLSFKSKFQKAIPARSVVASKAVGSSVWSRASSRRPESRSCLDSFFCWSCCTGVAISDWDEDPLPPSPRLTNDAPNCDAVEVFHSSGSSTKLDTSFS